MATSLFILLLVFQYCDRVHGQSEAIAFGRSKINVSANLQDFELYCYKPATYRGERMILVMHGVNRNADQYRDHAQSMGDRFEALIVAPKFDAERFPSIKYNRGGIMTEEKQAVDKDKWTYQLIPAIAHEVCRIENRSELPYWIIGHSAGGQFVARMAAFFDPGAQRLVAANPGSQLFPSRQFPFGYGFGDLPDALADDDRMKAYLAAPLTIYLGTADDHADEYFDDSPDAMQQGPGRLQRGQACFEFAKELAAKRNWPFRWRLVLADGVGHDHEAMFDHAKCKKALFGD